MKDITTIGEILIDLTQTGTNELGIPQFSANPGGAPANLAVAAAKLGASTAFIGRAGSDSFGRYLLQCLKEYGVDTGNLLLDSGNNTTLAVVSVDADGERNFSFYRNPGADTQLNSADIPETVLKDTRYLHFGSVSLTTEPCRSATLYAAKTAREYGAIISYDPNYRASLWNDEEDAIQQMLAPLYFVDVLKVSDEELPLLTGTKELEAGSAILAEYGVRLVLVTLGAKGVYYRMKDMTGIVPGVPCSVADTNGSGDTFFGALLSQLVKTELDAITLDELERILSFANHAASITTSRHGAIPAMPTLEEVLTAQQK